MSQIQVELQEHMGSDKSIADAAWTSSLTLMGKKNRTEKDVTRVVNMLADSRHSVPFEAVVLRFWIRMPIQTDRQHMTHRIASHNGMSGRYRTMPDDHLEVPDDIKEICSRFEKGSFYAPYVTYEYRYKEICSEANRMYRAFLDTFKKQEQAGIISNAEYKRLREFFRGMLPQNNMTERTTIMNLRSFANYQKLRNSEHAQPEIRQIAQLMLKQVEDKNICPVAIEALKRNGWNI